MTESTVEVTQADRWAAALLQEEGGDMLLSERILAGWEDGHIAVQAFARHRATATPGRVDAEAMRALAWLAGEQTTDEVLNCGDRRWSQLSVKDRLEEMRRRRHAHDVAVLDARAAIRALPHSSALGAAMDGEGR